MAVKSYRSFSKLIGLKKRGVIVQKLRTEKKYFKRKNSHTRQWAFKSVYKCFNSFLVWDASLLATVSSSQCLDMIGGKIESGLERGFVKHRL